MSLISLFDGTLVRIGNEVKRFDAGALIPDYADEAHVALLKERQMIGDGVPAAGIALPTGPVPFDVDAEAKASKGKASS